jgi:hypothetical protein
VTAWVPWFSQAEIDWYRMTEGQWMGHELSNPDPECWDWQPSDPEAFGAMLDFAMGAAPPGPFLDVGAGIGTKVLIAASRDLDASGIERVPEFVSEAAQMGATVTEADLRTWDGYGNYGIVYVNPPLFDEPVLWQLVEPAVQPGAVMITMHTEHVPDGWQVIYDGVSARNRRGVWKKV